MSSQNEDLQLGGDGAESAALPAGASDAEAAAAAADAVQGVAPASSIPAIVGAIVTCCPTDLRQTVETAVTSANYQVSLDPALAESLRFLGPVLLARETRLRMLLRNRDAKEVWNSLSDLLADVQINQSSSVALAVLVVERDVDALARRIRGLASGTELAALPVNLSGISLDPSESLASGTSGLTGEGIQLARLNSFLVKRGSEVVVEAEQAPDMAVPATLLADVVSSFQPISGASTQVQAARDFEDERAAAHSALVAAQEAPPTPTMFAQAPEWDSLAAQGSPPVRFTYLVVGLGAETRSREMRRRVAQLAVDVDHALVPRGHDFTSRTQLITPGREGAGLNLATGELTTQHLPKPSTEYLDMTEVMERVLNVVTDTDASFKRRSIPLTKPLVVFIMPTAAISGERCLSHYNQIADFADIAWLVTDPEARPPSFQVDESRVVTWGKYKVDVLGELLEALGYPLTQQRPPEGLQATTGESTPDTASEAHDPDDEATANE